MILSWRNTKFSELVLNRRKVWQSVRNYDWSRDSCKRNSLNVWQLYRKYLRPPHFLQPMFSFSVELPMGGLPDGKVGDVPRLAWRCKSRTLVSVRVLVTTRHHFYLSQYLLGCSGRNNKKGNAFVSVSRLLSWTAAGNRDYSVSSRIFKASNKARTTHRLLSFRSLIV